VNEADASSSFASESGESAADSDDAPLAVVLVNAPPAVAPAIARALVERRLAACVNVVPRVASVYRWEGAVVEDEESTLVVKTRAALVDAIAAAMPELHPYAVPEVIALPIDAARGNAAYLRWVRAETTAG
jgi:periplasmic divalent cation tolerance protein